MVIYYIENFVNFPIIIVEKIKFIQNHKMHFQVNNY